jgi:predicted anti-sigma-YlaC factor YlaD
MINFITNGDIMDCQTLLKRICDELSEDINSPVCREIATHLQQCSECRNQLSSIRNTVNLFRCLEDKQVPPHVHKRLMTLLNVPDHQ